MRSFIQTLALCAAMMYMASAPVMAQQISIVSGKVLNLPEGEKKARPFPVTEKVYVFAFNTVAAARDALKQLEGGGGTMMSDADAVAGPDGYYEIRVAENGALIFRVAMKSELLEVNYKQTIDLSIDGGIALDEVEVVAESKRPQPKPVAGKIVGNKLIVDNSVTIPNNYGAANRRLIMQPYVLDCTTEDTVRYIDPTVIDGVEYGLTQDRRMAYNMKNDILAPFINQRRALNEERFDLIVKDSVPVPDPRRIYSVLTKVIIADYTHPTYQDEWKLTTCKIKRPLQFLEFSFPDFALDPNKYKETPRRERRNTAGNISLTFLVGKAQLDPEDPNNELQMNKLKNNLLEIINGEGTTLKEFKITGVSSPEGRYASNLALAKERTNFALQQITSVIPAEKWKRVYKHPTETRVATWDEVADLLEQDSLLNEAEEIRAVTKKFKNPDAQFATISRLPYYATTIKERLPRLRTVQYEYKHEIFRELNPDEILDRYQNDPNYREGKKQFTRYEYWHLFQMVKDPKEAEKIFRRAYKETMAYDLKGKEKPWILAANNLAIALLRRDTFDIEVLKPLVDITRKVNLVDRFNDGISVIETEVNPEVVVANQLAMYIRAYNFDDASILAGLLPDTERFQMIKAFANCLGGYYDYRGAANVKESEERKKVFQLVKSSSPMNNIVMCMAMETDLYNREAEKILKEMPVNALTKYLKLVLFIRANKLYEWSYDNALAFDEACKMLDEIIKMETKYHKIAENDGEISKEFMEYFDQGDWKLY
ncbi:MULTISPECIES: hypothetical protein [Bacteroides]|uniref:hypothetical protein n=1 Tax=Bacteroides TaxID=816 RepID=UPI001F1FAA7B|nr:MULTISPECIES: hypothetical protein [Bacteroides]